MKKVRVAYSGVFDLKNYGDHLFPLIFQYEMKKRGLELELLLFSNFECMQNFEGNYKIYALEQLDEIHRQNPIDVVIVGGGEIIHPYTFKQILKTDETEDEVDYAMLDVWLKPLLFCERNNIPCILNGVGIPYELGEESVIAKLFNICEYISVRNETSKKILVHTGVKENIEIIPDSAFLVSEVYSEQKLCNIRKRLRLPENYIVFQCGKGLPKEVHEPLKELLRHIQEKGYEVVFLPLAYTNGDDIFLNELAREYNISIRTFPRELHVSEIVAVLAGCSQYVGLSFHGAITAAAYGIAPVLYDYYNQIKTAELYDYLGLVQLRSTTIQELNDSLQMREKVNEQKFSDTVEKINLQLQEHFDKIHDMILNHRWKDIPRDMENYKESYIQTMFQLKEVSAKSEQRRQETDIELQTLRSKSKELEEMLTAKTKELELAHSTIIERERTIEDYKMELENREELAEKVKKDMESLQFERDLLETFHQEVLHSKAFRVLHLFDIHRKNKE